MGERPKLRLSRLRDIGWSLWDPIGLKDFDENLEEASFAGEYDSYLVKVAGMLRNGDAEAEAADYLIWVETVHMGLSSSPEQARARAAEVVKAIQSDDQIWG